MNLRLFGRNDAAIDRDLGAVAGGGFIRVLLSSCDRWAALLSINDDCDGRERVESD
jgi:hypothetical protein